MSGFMGRSPESAGAPGVGRIAKHARRIVFLSNLTVRDGVGRGPRLVRDPTGSGAT